MQMRFLSLICGNIGKVGVLKGSFVRGICAGNLCGDFVRGICAGILCGNYSKNKDIIKV